MPEFPIHLRTIGRGDSGHSSCNVDFLAVAEDLCTCFFVELKTDPLSRRCEQDDNLSHSKRVGLPELLKGVIQIAGGTKKKMKYLHLLCLLEDLGLLSLPPGIRRKHAAANLRGLTADLEKAKVIIEKCPIEILYLQPRGDGNEMIGFDEFADWLRLLKDPISGRFRQSLLLWSQSTAGDHHVPR